MSLGRKRGTSETPQDLTEAVETFSSPVFLDEESSENENITATTATVDSDDYDLISDIVGHFERLAIQIVILFVFYILGRLGLFWTTLVLLLAWYYGNTRLRDKYKVVDKVLTVLKSPKPRDPTNIVYRRPRDLPRWVRFPDEESVHWANNVVKHLWPLISKYSVSQIESQVEPLLASKAPKMLQPAKLSTINLGSIAPIVGAVQVYNEDFTKRDEIIIDFELYYAGNSKIELSLKNIAIGSISNVQFYGHCRLVLSPLTKQLPLVDAVKLYFTRMPQILWQADGLFNVLEFPKVNDMATEVALDMFSKYFVFPNGIQQEIRDKTKDKFTLNAPIAEGVLRIALRGANNLMNKDTIGKSDPYCVISVGSERFKSKTVENSLRPCWNEFYETVIYNPVGLSVDFYLYDEDVRNDEELGAASFSVSQVKSEGFIDVWTILSDTKKGEIHVQMQYCRLLPSVDPFEKRKQSIQKPPIDVRALQDQSKGDIIQFGGESFLLDSFSRCYINVFVDSAQNLPRNHPSDMRAYPSPYVKISVPGAEEKTSKIIKDMCNPVWEQGFDFLINDAADKCIKIEVFDSEKMAQYFGHAQNMLGNVILGQNSTVQHRVIGTVKIYVHEILDATNLTLEMPFLLDGQGTVDSRILLKLTARFVVQQDADTFDLPSVNSLEWAGSSAQGGTSESSNRFIRNPSIRSSQSGSGSHPKRLFLRIRFVKDRNKLFVEVEKAQGLRVDKLNAYVTLKLMPDGVKKKTDHVKLSRQGSSSHVRSASTSSLDEYAEVVWKKTFEFSCHFSEFADKTLEACVKNHTGFVKSDTHFGYVSIPLNSLSLDRPVYSGFSITCKPSLTATHSK